MTIFTRNFWKASTERAVRTAAQSAILVIGADQFNVITVDWAEIGGFALGGAVLAYLTALGASQLGQDGGPAVTDAETISTARHAR